MTLLIAILLIQHMGIAVTWYEGVAIALLYLMHLGYHSN
jgi:hypothetical protein